MGMKLSYDLNLLILYYHYYLLKYAKVWQDWNYGTFEGFLFFLCQNTKLIISFQL